MARGSAKPLIRSMVFGTLWLLPLALLPLAIGEAIDQGIAARDTPRC
ncbi:hypothetical protein GCM10029964_119600 [Kibdelosporangium lantanae]